MRGQQLRRSNLIVPGKTAGSVACELHVVRRIRIDEVVRHNGQQANVLASESPVLEDSWKLREVSCISDGLVTAKWNIEFAALIKPAKPVEASAIEIVEKLGRFPALPFSVFDQFVEASAMPIERLLFISHLDCWLETSSQLSVEIYEVSIDVI